MSVLLRCCTLLHTLKAPFLRFNVKHWCYFRAWSAQKTCITQEAQEADVNKSYLCIPHARTHTPTKVNSRKIRFYSEHNHQFGFWKKNVPVGTRAAACRKKLSIWGLKTAWTRAITETINLFSILKRKKIQNSHTPVPLPLFFSVSPGPYLPTFPSLWSVLGSAMMAWTATMASLILVCSSRSSSMCSRRRIWAASFRVASGGKCICLNGPAVCASRSLSGSKSSRHSPPVSKPRACLSNVTGTPFGRKGCQVNRQQISHEYKKNLGLKSQIMGIRAPRRCFTSLFWSARLMASGESLSWMRIRIAWSKPKENPTTLW